MRVGLYAICVWNWNWWLTQYHFLIKHWSQCTHHCSAPVVGLEYSFWLVSRYSTVRSGTVTWHEWGLWSGSLSSGGWEYFPGIPGACATYISGKRPMTPRFESWSRQRKVSCLLSIKITYASTQSNSNNTYLSTSSFRLQIPKLQSSCRDYTSVSGYRNFYPNSGYQGASY